MEVFAKRLKEMRTENNLTLEELAEILNVSPVAISRWERCIRIPNIVVLRDISNYFKVSANYFLGLED